ncbi:MAG: glycerophosphodiester phosphodiesterase family protein [Firmicutes bacterium]|nr:glycerophosphodiester phosphodiesterase family protein [Bacillota bacterium]
MKKTKVWAHRGASAYAPENTLEAFALAIEMKADGIEIDIRKTKDDLLVVCHNHIIDITSNGSGMISEMTYAELCEYDFSKGREGKYNHKVRIPLLAEVYDLLRPTSLELNTELKTWDPKTLELLAKLHNESGMAEREMFSCFNHEAFIELRKLIPDLRDGLLYESKTGDELPWDHAARLGAYALHPHTSGVYMYDDYVTKCHENNIAINVWTPDGEDELRRLTEMGVDGLITNRPDVALKIVNNVA